LEISGIFDVIICNYYCNFGVFLHLCGMRKGERILKKAFPERSEFSEEEIELAEKVIEAYLAPTPRSSALPTKYTDVGDILEIGGHRYECIVARRCSVPSEACSGCDFSRKYRNCSDVQCSPFDRRDGKFVWYKEVK